MNKQIKKVFDRYDIEGTGYLDSGSLYTALLEFKLPIQPEDIQDLLESVCRQKEGNVSFDDFSDIVTELKHDDFIPEKQEINSETVYQMLKDPNEQGITLDSLLKVCATQEPSWTNQQVMEMLNEADINHDGIINLCEFKIICKKIGLE